MGDPCARRVRDGGKRGGATVRGPTTLRRPGQQHRLVH